MCASLQVRLLLEHNLADRLPPAARHVSNDFRTARLYNEEVDLVLKRHQVRGRVCCVLCVASCAKRVTEVCVGDQRELGIGLASAQVLTAV